MKQVPQALEAGIELHFEAEPRPFPTQANPIMVNELLANLIDNAIRYNQSGGSVIVRLTDTDGKHVVAVEDDGPGIPDAERDKVFTRFYRLNRDQGRVGSGLGLAIVQSLATTLNAEVSMSGGTHNRGLHVRVSLPDAFTDAASAASETLLRGRACEAHSRQPAITRRQTPI